MILVHRSVHYHPFLVPIQRDQSLLPACVFPALQDYSRNDKIFGSWCHGYRKSVLHFLIHNCWLESGKQTLKDGTGVYIYDYSSWAGRVEHNEQEYKNYKRHGKQYTYTNGVISLYQEMEDGKENGRNYIWL